MTSTVSSVLDLRRVGVLLHPTSLPGPGSHGRLGADAYRFVDLLAAAGFSVWQMLPVGPVDRSLSPYSLKSALAGNPALIDPRLVESALMQSQPFDRRSIQSAPIEAAAIDSAPGPISLQEAARRYRDDFDAFVDEQQSWLLPFAYFEVLRRRQGLLPWWEWPDEYRQCRLEALAPLREDPLWEAVLAEQYFFERQWQDLRRYARERGVLLFGDLPFYVDRDSADVWWNREMFLLDADGNPTEVAGVPPDYFSEDGQLWGNPLFDWQAMQADGFAWWVQRLRVQLHRFDWLRIDHFRALESHWAVPAEAASARAGQWRPTPGAALLARLRAELGGVPLIAEDLGIITDEVRALRDAFALPGMLVLQFAFDGQPDNPYLPRNHVENAVVYTGTHDNDTTLGWYRNLDDDTRRRMHEAIGGSPEDMPGALIRAAYESPARLAVLPMQDLLGLGGDARMNVPGVADGNWRWRFAWEQVGADFVPHWRDLGESAGRVLPAPEGSRGLKEVENPAMP